MAAEVAGKMKGLAKVSMLCACKAISLTRKLHHFAALFRQHNRGFGSLFKCSTSTLYDVKEVFLQSSCRFLSPSPVVRLHPWWKGCKSTTNNGAISSLIQ